MMKVLLVGSGGREHALATMIRYSAIRPKLYVASDYLNPGLYRDAEESGGRLYVANTSNPHGVLKIAEEVSPDLIVIGPEEPQFAGVADVLREKGFTVFGAGARCAEIEKSKVFARTLMWKYSIPGRLFFKAFRDVDEARTFIEYAGDVVIKPARQAGGKGVKVLRDTKAYLSRDVGEVKKSYIDILHRHMEEYKDIDYRILVEQRVEGVEYTVQVVTDGSTVLPLPIIQDHPHAYEFDVGPETGGMGSIMGPGWTLSFITFDEYRKSIEIVEEVLRALQKEVGDQYRGAFAGQMMLTGLWGPTIIEFYSRFGDPEISNLVPVVESDFLEILDRAAEGRLASVKLSIDEEKVVIVKAIAPAGYPESKKLASGHPIAVDDRGIREKGCIPLYASIEMSSNGVFYTKGSRVIEIVCSGNSYEDAYRRSEEAVRYVQTLDGWPLFYRSDIGSQKLLEYRSRVAERVRRVYLSRARRGLLGEAMVWIPGQGILSNPLLSPIKVGGL